MSVQQMRSNPSSLSIERACELLDLPRIEYYRWIDRADYLSKRTQEDLLILEEIREILMEFTGYGYRRVTKELQNRGYDVNHKRILRLMHDSELLCKKKRTFVPRTTDSDHNNPVYPNLIRDLEITHPDQVWVSDITYIQLDKGFAYLSSILDVFTRKCIGWNMSNNLRTDLAMGALDIAIVIRWNSNIKGLIHHSDRGVQYTSNEYTDHLKDHGHLNSELGAVFKPGHVQDRSEYGLNSKRRTVARNALRRHSPDESIEGKQAHYGHSHDLH